MKKTLISKKDQFIKGYYIKDEVCDFLLNHFKNNENLAVPGVLAGYDGEPASLPEFKQNKEMFFEHDSEGLRDYLIQLSKCKDEYLKDFPSLNELGYWGLYEPIKLQKYEAPGDNYIKFHCERDASRYLCRRLLVYMTYLNDVPHGGETEFLYQKLKIKPKKGLTLIWPADFTHTHRGLPVTKYDKYIVTGWISFVNNG